MKYVRPVEVYTEPRFPDGAGLLVVKQYVDGTLSIHEHDDDEDDQSETVTMTAAHFEAIAAALGYVRAASGAADECDSRPLGPGGPRLEPLELQL